MHPLAEGQRNRDVLFAVWLALFAHYAGLAAPVEYAFHDAAHLRSNR